MPTNFYFQSGLTSGTTNEQRLVEDLIIESLKIYGQDIYYLPRTRIATDDIFDEDTLSQFNAAYPLEMYIQNVDGFEGQGDLFTKFGIEIRDQASFVLSKRRWEQLVETSGGTFALDARPAEGDLLFFPLTGSLFEIKLVEFQNPFYQLSKINTFIMQCELFEYSSEVFDTGLKEVDDIYETQSIDMFLFQFLLEDDSLLLQEGGESLILEDYAETKSTANTDNTNFITENEAQDIIDFSEINPFGEIV
tara:strand:- start:1608 stop:2354 length:747 start_codon:yes stop_codon:yes gene_type:complete